MATDPRPDRHHTRHFSYRPSPADLLERLDATVGSGQRSAVLSDLLARYLDGRPMPARPWRTGNAGKPGQHHGE